VANITNIPAPRVAFIDPRTGLMAREWYRFFVNLFTLTGSGQTDISITDLAVSPPVEADNSQDIAQNSQLAAMMAQYDQAYAAIQGAYLNPPANVGTIATQNADRVAITGGTASLTSVAATTGNIATVNATTVNATTGVITGLTTAGGAVFHTTNTALTNGAAGSLGTLTNAPAAGDPTKWIGINDNGTTRYLPAW
jgi:hypothetical protein